MPNLRCETGLVEKHRHEVVIIRQMSVHEFDGDKALEPAHAIGSAKVYLGHSTGSDGSQKFIAPELFHRIVC